MNRHYPPRAWPRNQTVGATALVLIARFGEMVLRNDWRVFAAGIAAAAVVRMIA